MAQGSQNPATGTGVPSLPENFEPLVFAGFEGIDTTPKRPAVDDRKVPWMTNLFPLGANNIKALPDVGLPFYTAPGGRTIVYFEFFQIQPNGVNNGPLCAVFLDDGSAVQVNVTSLVQVTMAPPGTFAPPAGTEIVARQYGTSLLLIATEQSNNSYWVWDGTLLYGAGTLSPETDITSGGVGYTSAPTLGFVGGSGSGAAATATVAGGSVTKITITNQGSAYGDTDDTQVLVTFTGGGSGTTAYGSAAIVNNAITAITIQGGGSGFTSLPGISITGGGGSGAQAIVSGIAGGSITSIKVIDCGSGYTSQPTIATSGGGGGGLNATAVISNGVLNSVSMTSNGSGYGGVPTVSFICPTGSGASGTAIMSGTTVSGVDFGEGAGAGFSGTGYTGFVLVVFSGGSGPASALATLMPFGVQGQAIEAYQSRAWITTSAGVVKTFFTVAGSAIDFSPARGAGVFPATDSTLVYQWTNLLQSNGFLYLIGDSSTNYISGVQTTGSPPLTTFSNLNVDPENGTPWRDSVIAFGRGVIFANPTGVFALYGGAITKISDELDGVFNTGTLANVTNSAPSSAKANIFDKRVYLLLLPIIDPVSGASVNALFLRYGNRWFPVESQVAFKKIRTLETGSNITAYGNSGTSLYQLFSTPSTATSKFVQSKLYGVQNIIDKKKSWMIWAMWKGDASSTLTFTQDSENGSAAANQGAFASTGGAYGWGRTTAPAAVGYTVGWSMTSTSPQFTLMNVTLGQQDYERRT